MIKIGINGFGRIGRALTRILSKDDSIEIIFINDINPNIDNLSYLLKYDSTYGQFELDVKNNNNEIIIENKKIKCFDSKSIKNLPWDKIDIDYLVDASGVSKNISEAKNLLANNKFDKYIITHCSDESDIEVIMGVNDDKLIEDHKIISNSICDANAVAHIIKWCDEEYGILNGSLTTLHPWLSYQNLLDGPSISQSNPGVVWSDYSLGRSSIESLIPKNTTAIEAVEKVLPQIKNKIMSYSYRVPTPTVASSDLVLNLDKIVDKDMLLSFIKERCKNNSFVTINNESLVSKDYQKSNFSAIIDLQWLKVNENTVKIMLWYDNEWGYSSRIPDLIKKIKNI